MRSQTHTAAFGLYLSGVDLQSLVGELSGAGFPNEDICVVLPADHDAAGTLRSLQTGTPDSASQVENVLAWLARFGAVVVPSVGAFVAGREFVGMLFGVGCKPRACNQVLHSLGIPQADADRYEEWVNLGGSVAYVCCDHVDRVQEACEILEDAGAEEVSWLDEADVHAEFGALREAC